MKTMFKRYTILLGEILVRLPRKKMMIKIEILTSDNGYK
jgi:hypothetical protein